MTTITLWEIVVPKPKPVIPIEPEVKSFIVRGLLKDSTNNQVINATNVSLLFINKKTGQKIATESQAGGIWQVNVTEGAWRVDVNAEGFAEQEEIRVFKGPSDEKDLKNVIFLSPTLNGWRFTLTWGAMPLDLDAHIIMPDNSEIYFDPAHRKSADGKVTLDTDAQTGFGPETITLNQPAPGVYTFYVNRYSNEVPIQKSDAKVVVIHGNKKVREFRVPITGDQTLPNWVVLNLDTSSNTFEVVDQLSS